MHTGNRRQTDRRGIAYMLVLAISIILTTIGVSAMAVTRINTRMARDANDWAYADQLAFAGIEHALTTLSELPDSWRDTFRSSQGIPKKSLGRGQFRWTLRDEAGKGLSQDPLAPVRITGYGTVGKTLRMYSVLVAPGGGTPMNCLATTLTAGGDITFSSAVKSDGAPITTAQNAAAWSEIVGDLECGTLSGAGPFSGTVTHPDPPRTRPAASALEKYTSQATKISYSDTGGSLDSILLSPMSNPFGDKNGNGVYRIQVSSYNTLTVRRCRIVGTLIVSLGTGAQLNITDITRLERGHSGYPTIIVEAAADCSVNLKTKGGTIDESDLGVNFNPEGTPFEGETDAALDDAYSTLVQGPMWILNSTTTLAIGTDHSISGPIVTDGTVEFNQSAHLVGDPSVLADPPPGFLEPGPLAPVPDSWTWEVLP